MYNAISLDELKAKWEFNITIIDVTVSFNVIVSCNDFHSNALISNITAKSDGVSSITNQFVSTQFKSLHSIDSIKLTSMYIVS